MTEYKKPYRGEPSKPFTEEELSNNGKLEEIIICAKIKKTMNLVETLNAQREAAHKDLNTCTIEIQAMMERHAKELKAAKASRKLLESILRDIDKKIDKLQVK